jgi:hypothetical protein
MGEIAKNGMWRIKIDVERISEAREDNSAGKI